MSWYDRYPEQLPEHESHWASPEFEDELRVWVTGAVGPLRSLTPVKQRPWASVWRAETAHGTFFAKQNCTLQSYEAAAVARLASWAPELTVPVVAVDPDRGLLLTADQGQTLEPSAEPDLEAWAVLLQHAALLQRAAAPHASELACLGMAVMAARESSSYAAARLDQVLALPPEDPRRVSPADAERVRAGLRDLDGWAQEVAALGLPLTIQHNDLHEHNVFAGSHRYFDFADAVVAEPLGVLLVPLRALAGGLRAGAADPRLARVVEPYLEVWSDLAPLHELRAAVPAGARLGRLARTESYVRVTASCTPEALRDWGQGVSGWLAMSVEPAWLQADEPAVAAG